MKTYKIAVLAGSLRKESYNLKMAKVRIGFAPASLALQLVSIGDVLLGICDFVHNTNLILSFTKAFQ